MLSTEKNESEGVYSYASIKPMIIVRRDKRFIKLTVISFIGNAIVILAFFYQFEPVGSLIYLVWFSLGWILFWLGLPRKDDFVTWVRLIKKRLQGQREQSGL